MSAARTLSRLSRVLEHAGTGLSLPQYRLLAMVADGGERATALAGRLSLSKPTITAAVDTLVERGLVKRMVVEGDRRAVRIEITPSGRDALAQADRLMEDRLEPIFAKVRDRRAVLAAIEQLGAALDEVYAEKQVEPSR